jgi:hypothetical protein
MARRGRLTGYSPSVAAILVLEDHDEDTLGIGTLGRHDQTATPIRH